MKKFLILAICLISFSSFSQEEEYDEDDTLEFYTEYHLLDYKKWTETIFEPTEENREWDALSKIMYNPIVNNEVLDSVLIWRESKGYESIEVDWHIIDKKMIDNMSWIGMDLSKSDSDSVTMGRFEDAYPDCDCVNSIVTSILDDSTINLTGRDAKQGTIFNSILLNDRIKRIEVYYYQVSPRDNPTDDEEHLQIVIRKKFRLFSRVYNLY
jgi:hypothetical protein